MSLKSSLRAIALFLAASASLSCSPLSRPLSVEEKAAITAIAIKPCQINADAYLPPSGADTAISQKWGANAYMWSGGDNVVGLASNIITSSIARGQQNDFTERNASLFPTIKSNLTKALPDAVKRSTHSVLKNSPLGPKLSNHGTTVLETRVRHYGVCRVGLDPTGQVLLTPWLTVEYRLITPQNRIALFWVSQHNRSTISHPLSAYVANPALLRLGLEQAAHVAATEFNTLVRTRIGPSL